ADLLLAAVDEKDEILPDLILAIEDAAKNPANYVNGEHQLYYWAVYLLTYFETGDAFATVLRLFKLNATEFSPIVSDIIDEDGAMILANLCGGNVDPIVDLLHDPARRNPTAAPPRSPSVSCAFGVNSNPNASKPSIDARSKR